MTLALIVSRKDCIAQDVYRFELVRAASDPVQDLPAFSAGAHITVLTPNGLTRRYSLCNSPHERYRYVIAVRREAGGLGGSISLVDGVAVGDTLPMVAPPLNYFELAAGAQRHLLIAGGIGVTPLLAMVHALKAQGADFHLLYLSRSAGSAPFLDELSVPGLREHVTVHHSHGDAAQRFNLAQRLAQQKAGEHLYCCGPRALMQAVREHTRHWTANTLHFEDFGSAEPAPTQTADGAFEVALKKSGITVTVPAGMSILEALRGHGLSVPSSCESGTCGTCRTPLLAGEADHRDYVLGDDEQANEIMICVSRAKSALLELEL